jgi:lysophospholipase L1-like esterase
LWVRERYAVVDKIVLTTDAGYVPDGFGPLESTRFAEPVDYITIGDSITVGVGDDNPSDDISQDGRNSGGGFVPILNDLLASGGYPHTFVNEAESGTTSTDGLMDLPIILQRNPDAQRVLIMFGMNDARPWLPKPSGLGKWPGDSGYAGTYKDNIQRMLDLIWNDSKAPVLAKVNIALGDSSTGSPYPDPNEGARSVLIQEYNQVVDELFLANTYITYIPPDFYSYFEINHPTEYFDNVHPNGIGYRSMAEIWNDILTDPAYRR